MKRNYLFFFLFLGILLAQCKLHKKEAYNIPATMPYEQRVSLLAKLEKGKQLYKENCSQCHGIFTKGADGVPNFSKKQIDQYSARFIMRDRQNHAVAFRMDPERLGDVIQYLRYRVTKGDTTATMSGGK